MRIEEKPLPTQPVNCLIDIERLRLLGMKMKGGEDDAGIAEWGLRLAAVFIHCNCYQNCRIFIFTVPAAVKVNAFP